MFDQFKDFAPASGADNSYSSQTSKIFRAKFYEVAANVQKFQ